MYGNRNTSHIKFPHVNMEENMNVSMHAYRDNGNIMYGRAICAGVCCIKNLKSKSTNNINGRMSVKSSAAVVVRDSLAIIANGIDSPMRYITTNDIDR